MIKFSVNIICYNEAENIRDCLESVRWADEIVVVDSHSTDGTTAICQEYNARIYQEDFTGYGKIRNTAIEKSSHDWILSLDADERLTPELREEILREFKRGPAFDAYAIPRKSYFLGHWIWSCGWYPDYRSTQLFHRKAGRYTEVLNDDHFECTANSRKGYLKNHILHYTYKDVDHYLAKLERYTTLKAQQMKKDGRRFSPHQLVTHPVFMFFKMYILRRGFMQGKVGMILSLLYTYYTFLKYAKLWELTRNSADAGRSLADETRFK